MIPGPGAVMDTLKPVDGLEVQIIHMGNPGLRETRDINQEAGSMLGR
jgi:hypothetical protein